MGCLDQIPTLFELLKRDDLAALMAMALSPNELCEVEELCACQRFTSKDKRSHCHGDVEIKRFPLSDFTRNSYNVHEILDIELDY